MEYTANIAVNSPSRAIIQIRAYFSASLQTISPDKENWLSRTEEWGSYIYCYRQGRQFTNVLHRRNWPFFNAESVITNGLPHNLHNNYYMVPVSEDRRTPWPGPPVLPSQDRTTPGLSILSGESYLVHPANRSFCPAGWPLPGQTDSRSAAKMRFS